MHTANQSIPLQQKYYFHPRLTKPIPFLEYIKKQIEEKGHGRKPNSWRSNITRDEDPIRAKDAEIGCITEAAKTQIAPLSPPELEIYP